MSPTGWDALNERLYVIVVRSFVTIMTDRRRHTRTQDVQTGDEHPQSLAGKAMSLSPRTATSPWEDHEHGRGYVVLVLPFSSGHQLGLRVFPENDFAPYVSVWHRPPEKSWSVYVDGPSLETTCPRYWGPVLDSAALTTIDVTWTGPSELRIEMEKPELTWMLSIDAPRALRVMNTVSSALPLSLWTPNSPMDLWGRVVPRFLDALGIRFPFTTATDHEAVLMAQETYIIDEAEAVLNGRSLGDPVRLTENPTIGDVPLPPEPYFIFGQVHMRITDREEYVRTKERIHDMALGRFPPGRQDGPNSC